MASKQRLDIMVFERGLAPSREKARAMIMAGEVLVNGKEINKPGTQVSPEMEVVTKNRRRYVSRGGDKLAGALHDFGFDVSNCISADVGASTGGFTDCLLQRGVKCVYAIDVGYGQFDYALQQDNRVVLMERTNARHVEKLEQPVNLVVVDASFISLTMLLPVIRGWLCPEATVITLIKPQFEAGRQSVRKGGVVRDSEVHRHVLHNVLSFAQRIGFSIDGLTVSPLKGPAGNIEFFARLGWGLSMNISSDISALIGSLIP